MQVANLLTLTELARKLDRPVSELRNRVESGAIRPDATARNGRKMFVLFKPSRLETLRVKLATN